MVVTQSELKESLAYDLETGVFVWIKTYRNQNLGKVAGILDKDGYRQIKFNHKSYRAHRLAWLYVYGVWPSVLLDHIDGVKDHNAISNLREVTFAENSQNRRTASKDSLYGFLGVDYNKTKKRFRARIQTGGKRINLGGFATADEAYEAYLEAKRKYHVTCTI